MELIGRGEEYAVPVSGSQGVQVGHHNIQVSYYTQEQAGQDRLRPTESIGRALIACTQRTKIHVRDAAAGDVQPLGAVRRQGWARPAYRRRISAIWPR